MRISTFEQFLDIDFINKEMVRDIQNLCVQIEGNETKVSECIQLQKIFSKFENLCELELSIGYFNHCFDFSNLPNLQSLKL